jgi:hypothetical protein
LLLITGKTVAHLPSFYFSIQCSITLNKTCGFRELGAPEASKVGSVHPLLEEEVSNGT